MGGRLLRAALELEYFAREFCFTLYNGPDGPETKPFPLYDFLEPFFAAFLRRDNIHWEKSRQMLASWAVMIAMLWGILFHRNRTYFVISERAELVDDRGHTHNCLFGKLHFLIRHLCERVPELTELISLQYMGIHVPCNNSAILGFAATENAARSGSPAGVLLDEASKIRLAEEINASMVPACPRGRIYLGTPNGPDGLFARLRWKDRAGLTFIRTHWSQHPERDGAWYKSICENLTDLQIAQDLDISYARSTQGRVFSRWKRELFFHPTPMRPREPIMVGWDFGMNGTAMVFCQTRKLRTVMGNTVKQWRIFDFYENVDQPARHYREILQAKIVDWPLGQPHKHVGDPWMLDQRESDSFSWYKRLKRVEADDLVRVFCRPARITNTAGQRISIPNLIENVAKLMRMVEVEGEGEVPLLEVDSTNCQDLATHFEGYRRPTDRSGNITSEMPLKDAHSHSMDGVQYVVNTYDPLRTVDSDSLQRDKMLSAGRITSPDELTIIRGHPDTMEELAI